MSSKPTTWDGAPPVCEDGFAFGNNDFYAEASGQNRHRRASALELSEHFARGTPQDHPAHWFEAQLLHYGLKSSKTKATARMRLFDAVKAGNLTVPSQITNLEKKLKKEWLKKDKEAKKQGPAQKKPSAASKRKLESTDLQSSAEGSRAKKGKTSNKASTAASATGTNKKTATKAGKSPSKTTARTLTTAASSSQGPTSTQLKQTARRGRPARGGSVNQRVPTSPPAPQPEQRRSFARRSNAFMARGRIPSSNTSAYVDPEYDEPPPPYSTYEDDWPGYSSQDSDRDEASSESSQDGSRSPLPPLGLLNGTYELESPSVTSQWDFDDSDFSLVFTMSGSSLWAGFSLGVIEGIMYFSQRPMQSSHDLIPFIWRGSEDQGPIRYGNNNRGWIRFLGDGYIEGEVDFMRLGFHAQRHEGQGTRSPATVQSLRDEWNSYTESRYEEENRARW